MSSSSKDRLLLCIWPLLDSCIRVIRLASEIQFGEDLRTSQDQVLAVLINLNFEIQRSLRYILEPITLPTPLFTSVLLGSTRAVDLFERRLRLYRFSSHGREYVCDSWIRLIERLQQYTMNLQGLTSTSDLDSPDAICDASSLQRLFNCQNNEVLQELEAQIRYEGRPRDVSPDTPGYLDVQQEYPPSSIADGDIYDELPAIPGPPLQAPSLLFKEQQRQAAIQQGREREREKFYETLKTVLLSDGKASEKQRSSHLMGAIKSDSVHGVNIFLDLGADVNEQCDGNLPLCLAAKRGHDRVVETLLERGAEIDKLSAYGSTALLSAAGTGRVSTIGLLLDRKANTEARSTSPHYLGYTPLMRAVKSGRMDAIRVLVERGANVRTQNDAGESLLHVALRDGRKEIIEQVLGLQPHPGAVDVNGNTELHVAATQGLVDVCRQLVGPMKCHILTGNRNKETPLHCAVKAKKYELVTLFLSEGAMVEWRDIHEKTPLHLAVEAGCQEIVQLLLNANASPCKRDQYGKTPIHYAIDLSNKDLVQLLAEEMSSVDAKGGNKETPLHYAVKSLNVEIVRFLLSQKATANCKDRDGKVPLEHVMELPESDEKTAIRLIQEFLRSHEKGQLLTSTYGFPALSQAARHGRVQLIEVFCKHDPNLANENPAADSGFEPPLHEAIKGGHRKSVDKLCEFPETDKNILDREGNTPLHQAIDHWQDGLLAMLIHCGADKDRPHATNGLPPLHFAAKSQSLKKVQELLNAKADPDKRIKGEQCQWCKDNKRPPGMNARCVLQAIPLQDRKHEYAGINRVLSQTLLKSGHPRSASSDRSGRRRKRRSYIIGSSVYILT